MLSGIAVCLFGAIAADCYFFITGYTMLSLGVLTIVFGPLATTL